MKRLLVLATLLCAAAAAAGPAGATTECKGLQACVPVAGPWVIVPVGRAVPRPRVEYQLSCPKGFIVGGLDAELSDRAIDLGFLGTLGSPVNPGITTSRAAVFVGTYVGASARAPSFRPHVGCMPTSGGGSRLPTAVGAFPPGKPTVRRVKTVRVPPGGIARAVLTCARGETLIAATHAAGVFGKSPPTARVAGAIHAVQTVRGGRVVVNVRGGTALQGVAAVVQVDAVCAGGK